MFTGPSGLNTYRTGGNPFFGFFASNNTTRNGYIQWVDAGDTNIANEIGGTINLVTSTGSNFSISPTRVTTLIPLRLKGYTVGTLPAGAAGDTAYVTDALAPAFGAAVAAGGAAVVPVYYTGAAWFVG
jgi:hypothetical protein